MASSSTERVRHKRFGIDIELPTTTNVNILRDIEELDMYGKIKDNLYQTDRMIEALEDPIKFLKERKQKLESAQNFARDVTVSTIGEQYKYLTPNLSAAKRKELMERLFTDTLDLATAELEVEYPKKFESLALRMAQKKSIEKVDKGKSMVKQEQE